MCSAAAFCLAIMLRVRQDGVSVLSGKSIALRISAGKKWIVESFIRNSPQVTLVEVIRFVRLIS
jgi:hypothetical protein